MQGDIIFWDGCEAEFADGNESFSVLTTAQSDEDRV